MHPGPGMHADLDVLKRCPCLGSTKNCPRLGVTVALVSVWRLQYRCGLMQVNCPSTYAAVSSFPVPFMYGRDGELSLLDQLLQSYFYVLWSKIVFVLCIPYLCLNKYQEMDNTRWIFYKFDLVFYFFIYTCQNLIQWFKNTNKIKVIIIEIWM